jgi:hypothetical protein
VNFSPNGDLFFTIAFPIPFTRDVSLPAQDMHYQRHKKFFNALATLARRMHYG